MERFSHKLAIALRSRSRSFWLGGTSAGIEPIPGQYLHPRRPCRNSFAVKNPYLEHVLEAKGEYARPSGPRSWRTKASVQHLDFLADDEKLVFKTAFPRSTSAGSSIWPRIARRRCQSQSVNVFLPGDVDKWDLHMLALLEAGAGREELYYLRSKSVQRAAFAGAEMAVSSACAAEGADADYDECLACQ